MNMENKSNDFGFKDFVNTMFSLLNEEKNKKLEKEKYEASIDKLNNELQVINTILDKRDIDIRSYVEILELIRDIVIYRRNNSVLNEVQKATIYGRILEEIEPALDDLTLDTLQIVINQYNTIQDLEQDLLQYNDLFQSIYTTQIKFEVTRNHKKFKKIIKRHMR